MFYLQVISNDLSQNFGRPDLSEKIHQECSQKQKMFEVWHFQRKKKADCSLIQQVNNCSISETFSVFLWLSCCQDKPSEYYSLSIYAGKQQVSAPHNQVVLLL